MFNSQILVKEMNSPHCVPLKNNCPEWIIKELEKKPSTSIINLGAGLEIKKKVLISVHYIPDFSVDFRRIFNHTNVR